MDDPLAERAAHNAQEIMTVFIDASRDRAGTALNFDIAMHIAAIAREFRPGPGGFDDCGNPVAVFRIHKKDFEMCVIICLNLPEATTDQSQFLTGLNAQRT